MNLCLDSMDVMKIVLLIFEAMLLTDCVRGKGADSQMFWMFLKASCKRPRH